MKALKLFGKFVGLGIGMLAATMAEAFFTAKCGECVMDGVELAKNKFSKKDEDSNEDSTESI